MNTEKIPAYDLVKNKIKEIDQGIAIKHTRYDDNSLRYDFYLAKDNIECIVSIERDLLEDLNDFTGLRTSRYWLALEKKFEYKLSLPMQLCEIIPFSSLVFFKNHQDWEEDILKEVLVSYSPENYEIFQDGLKKLYDYLENQRISLEHLRLRKFPYQIDLEHIKDMMLVRNQQITESGPCFFKDKISLLSRKNLKAAAITGLIDLENELLQDKHTRAIKDEINEKIKSILKLLDSPVFERVKLPEYMHQYRDEKIFLVQKSSVLDSSSQKEYDVVLSFAGEDREYAEKMANLLKEDQFKFFYDKYEEHELWGKNLYDHLSEIYSKRGKYCVMFLSEHYAKKQWTTLERRSAQERAFREHREYILPIRLDDTEVPGILDTVGYQDLRKKSIVEIYEILKQKLLLS